MPASRRSLSLTDDYRTRLALLSRKARAEATTRWERMLDPRDLDSSHARWVASTAPLVVTLQRTGEQLAQGYLSAFVAAERRERPRPIRETGGAGRSRDDRKLSKALGGPVISVKRAIGEGGKEPDAALAIGLARAVRLIGDETIAPARAVVDSVVADDDRIIGWRRVTGGGCGACLAAATGAIQADDEVLDVHPNCQCSKEPVVRDAPDRVHRPTGHELFTALPHDAQDALLGAQKAELIRSGEVAFQDLIQHDPMAAIPDGITERPLQALLSH